MMISRAPLPKIEAFKKRMGWSFPWVSSFGNDFNHDYHVYFTPEEKAKGKVYYNYTMQNFPSQEAPGASVFYKDKDGQIFHTNSIYGRGLDPFITTYILTPLGIASASVLGQVVIAFIGAAILLAILRLVTRAGWRSGPRRAYGRRRWL